MKYSWDLLTFDTRLFGFKTAKINFVEAGSVRELISDLVQEKIEYATYRLPANNFSLVRELEQAGFLLVDGLLSLELDLKNMQLLSVDRNIREAKEQDIKDLREIAGRMLIANRFYNDPIIPKEKARQLYEDWAENSVHKKKADRVLVLEEDRKILGFITLEKLGRIALVAVDKNSQGKGIAKKIINAGLSIFKKWGVQKVYIETAIFNISALRAYQACGFKIASSYLTFRWSNR